MRTISVDILDAKSIEKAVEALQDYSEFVRERAAALEENLAHILRDLAAEGFGTAISDNVFSVRDGSPIDESKFADVKVYITNDDNRTIVMADGKDAVFVEFGAGVYHNGPVGTSPNPWGSELGYTIGSYGLGNGAKEVWGYRDADGLHLTHGTPASMPLYKAVMAVRQDIEEIAREVFRE